MRKTVKIIFSLLIIVNLHLSPTLCDPVNTDEKDSSDGFDPLLPFKDPPHFGQLHSLDNLSNWAITEELMYALLERRLELLEEEANLIKSFLADYEDSTGKAVENAYNQRSNIDERGRIVGSSIVLAHRMTSRFCNATKKLRAFLTSDEYKAFDEDVKNVLRLKPPKILIDENGTQYASEQSPYVFRLPGRNGSSGREFRIPPDWPDWQDMYMSMTSFITLQEVNGITPDKVVNGLTIDTSEGGQLHAYHCAEIGMFALRRKRYYMAVDWFQMAVELAKIEDTAGNETISLDLVQSMLLLAIQESNKAFNEMRVQQSEMGYTQESMELFMDPLTEEHIDNKIRMPNVRQINYFQFRGLGPDKWTTAQHIDICIGNNRQTPEMQINLKCYYENKRHPYLYINPVKLEKLSESPPVYQLYEILSNSTIDHIKWLASSRLKISTLVGIKEDDLDAITSHRTSVGAGLDYSEIPHPYKLAEMVSGLKLINASEPTQVVEYVYGRHYIHHPDTFDNETEASDEVKVYGDRVATMLYYLEVPELGGTTSFCQAGLGAHHVRGSAVLWYNMYRNGTIRNDVEHGACPVIHGHKIAGNHWIRYYGNWNHYKCSLNRLE